MKFLEEIKTLVSYLLKWFYCFLGAFVFFFSFGISKFLIFGKDIFLPIPTHHSFVVLLFQKIQEDFVPESVELIVTSPLEAFWAQVSIALFLSFSVTLPILLFFSLAYFLPAFTLKEKKAVFKVLLPSTILFFLGCVFSYRFLIPSTVELLYVFYAETIGVTTFFSLKDFVPLVLAMMFGVGVIFTLPVLMIILSYLGFIPPHFWKQNWRYSLVFFLLISAIITPDGSGVTMIFLSAPLTALYFLGYLGSVKFSKLP